MTQENSFIRYIDKTVVINTKKGFGYTGVVKEVADQGNGLVFLSIIDKFGKWVTFGTSEIVSINEVRG